VAEMEQGKISNCGKKSNFFSTVIFLRKIGRKAGYGLAEFGNQKKNFVFPNNDLARHNYKELKA
jgi:hypothetical protein